MLYNPDKLTGDRRPASANLLVNLVCFSLRIGCLLVVRVARDLGYRTCEAPRVSCRDTYSWYGSKLVWCRAKRVDEVFVSRSVGRFMVIAFRILQNVSLAMLIFNRHRPRESTVTQNKSANSIHGIDTNPGLGSS